MHLLKVLFLLFIFAILQTSILVPIFRSLILSPHVALLFLWVYGKTVGDRALVTSAFLLGLFFDALSNTWGAYTLTTVFFTYVYTVLRDTLIVKKEVYEFFFMIPILLILYKLALFPLVGLRTEVEFSVKKFGVSLLIEYLFILLFYKLKK